MGEEVEDEKGEEEERREYQSEREVGMRERDREAERKIPSGRIN